MKYNYGTDLEIEAIQFLDTADNVLEINKMVGEYRNLHIIYNKGHRPELHFRGLSSPLHITDYLIKIEDGFSVMNKDVFKMVFGGDRI